MMEQIGNDLEPGMYTGCLDVQQMILCNPKINRQLQNITPWLENWTGAFLHSVYHHFKDVKMYNSILFCALESQTMQLDWIRFSFCSGQYDMAMRELRNTIESGFLFFKYDYENEFRGVSVAEKYQRVKRDTSINKKNGYGKCVFVNSGYRDWKNAYKTIYLPLGRYVHTATNIERAMDVDNDGYNSIPAPYFNEAEIEKCIMYFKKVIKTEVKLMQTILKDVYDINDEYSYIFK